MASSDPGPQARLRRLANAYQISCAVHAAAHIRLGHHLEQGPLRISELARRGKLDEETLRRLLRFLETLDIVKIDKDDHISATDLTRRVDDIDNIAEGPEALKAWASLPDILQTGGNAFEKAHGTPFYRFAANYPDKAGRWAARNRMVADSWAATAAAALPLDGGERVVDLGAGGGALLAALLRVHPGIRPMLYELPHAVDAARADLVRHGMEDRVQVLTGDLTSSPPPEADTFILSRVLLNLSDADAVRVLSNCRRSMSAASTLIIVDTLMPDPSSPGRQAHYAHDLHLLLMWGGRQRTRAEFYALLEKAGFTVQDCSDICPGDGLFRHILTCRKAPSGDAQTAGGRL